MKSCADAFEPTYWHGIIIVGMLLRCGELESVGVIQKRPTLQAPPTGDRDSQSPTVTRGPARSFKAKVFEMTEQS